VATSEKKARTTRKKMSAKKKTAAKKAARAKKAVKKARAVKTAVRKKKPKTTKKTIAKKTTKKTTKKTAKKTAKKTKTRSAVKKIAKKTAKKAAVSKKTKSKKKTGKKAARRPAAGKTDSSLIHGIKPYKPKRGEEYMNAVQRTHFQGILNAWRQQLVDEISRTLHIMQDETVNHPDPNDRATQETDMSLELRSRDRERKLIRKIDETLLLIDAGDYGFCENCGVEIGIERLEARPTASLCIDCKTLDEIRERQMV